MSARLPGTTWRGHNHESAVRCPDCSRPVLDQHLQHDSTCPVGLACEAAMRDDAAWFRARPGAIWRRRPLIWAEGVEVGLFFGLPEGYRLVGNLVLEQVQPGVRLRHFDRVFAVRRGAFA